MTTIVIGGLLAIGLVVLVLVIVVAIRNRGVVKDCDKYGDPKLMNSDDGPRCPEGTISKYGECYPALESGFEFIGPGKIAKGCPEGTEDAVDTCIYTRKVGKDHKTRCGDDEDLRADQCYKKPPAGYDWTTPLSTEYGRPCPKETIDAGLYCTYQRKEGKPVKVRCPAGTVEKGRDCYKPLPDGYTWLFDTPTTEPFAEPFAEAFADDYPDPEEIPEPDYDIIHQIAEKCPPGTKTEGNKCVYTREQGKKPKMGCKPGEVQRGVECYEKPPEGWDWTTSGGLLIGKVCPAEVTEKGVTYKTKTYPTHCEINRGVGKVLDSVCEYPDHHKQEAGLCYKPRPVGFGGTGPILTKDRKIKTFVGKPMSCKPGEVQRAALCYDSPKPGREWTALASTGEICPKTVTEGNVTYTVNKHPANCEINRGTGVPFKLTCPPGKIQRGVECYDKPPTGYDWTTSGGFMIAPKCPPTVTEQGQSYNVKQYPTHCEINRGAGVPFKLTCPPGKIQRGVECYDKPPAGYEWTTAGGFMIAPKCPPTVTEQGQSYTVKQHPTHCEINRGAGVPFKLTCPPGKIQRGVECYDKPPAGYDWTTSGGFMIAPKCPPTVTQQGQSYNVKQFPTHCEINRGIGKPLSFMCPPGKLQRGALCYDPPKAGREWTATASTGDLCPTSVTAGPNQYTVRKFPTHCEINRGLGVPFKLRCPVGQVQRGAECYSPPGPGRNWTTPGGLIHGKVCPSGTNDSGTTCWYGRGAGRAPQGACPSGYSGTSVGTCYRGPHTFGRYYSAGWNGNCPTTHYKICHGICGASVVGCKLKTCPAGYQTHAETCFRPASTVSRPCAPGYSLQNGLCYKNCQSGFIGKGPLCESSKDNRWGTKQGTVQQYCPTPYTAREGALCYKPRPSGYAGTGPVLTKNRNIRSFTGTAMTGKCTDPAYPSKEGALCYKPWPAGYTGIGSVLTKSRPTRIASGKQGVVQQCPSTHPKREGALCYKPWPAGYTGTGAIVTKTRPTRVASGKQGVVQQCPSTHPKREGALCYKPWPAGYTGTGAIVTKSRPTRVASGKQGVGQKCPETHPSREGALCYKPWPKGYTGTGPVLIKDRKIKSFTGRPLSTCASGQVKRGLLCYDPPKPGREWTAVASTGEICPATVPVPPKAEKFEGFGEYVVKKYPTHCEVNRGVGKVIQLKCANPEYPSKEGALCYKPWPKGYTGTGPILIKDRGSKPGKKIGVIKGNCQDPGYVLDPAGKVCYPEAKKRFVCIDDYCTMKRTPKDAEKVSRGELYCGDEGQVVHGNKCYPAPKPGFKCTSISCRKERDIQRGKLVGPQQKYCEDPKHVLDPIDGKCYPAPKFPGAECEGPSCTLQKEIRVLTGDAPSVCPKGREIWGDACVKKCPPGHKRVGPCACKKLPEEKKVE